MKSSSIILAGLMISFAIVFGPDIRVGFDSGLAQARQAHRVEIEQQAYAIFRRECSFPSAWKQDWCRQEYVKRAWIEEQSGGPCFSDDRRLKEPLPDWLQERPTYQ